MNNLVMLERKSVSISRREIMLVSLLFLGMCLPVWIGKYAPLWDYANHLLEAQIVSHYHVPQLNYAQFYIIRPAWYLDSNALISILLAGLGKIIPIQLAGKIILTLYMALFVSGLWILLRRAKTVWPLLLVAPALAYNFTFVGGFLNFSLALALSMLALATYFAWEDKRQKGYLLLLGILLIVIYTAHVAAWGFLLICLALLAAFNAWEPARHGLLYLALSSALPFLLVTRPLLGLVAALIAPSVWLVAAIIRRLNVPTKLSTSSVVAALIVGFGVIRLSQPLRAQLIPEVQFTPFNKISFLFRTFSLSHQFYPSNPKLIIYNFVLLALIFLLGALLAWSTLQNIDRQARRQLAVSGLLGVLYILIPTRTSDITFIEPRVMMFMIIVALAGVRLPAMGSKLFKSITISTLALCLISLFGTLFFAFAYQQKAHAWSKELQQLAPATKILVMQRKAGEIANRPFYENYMNSFHSGLHYVTTYTIENGGLGPSVFDNGPVRVRPDIPIPDYNSSTFDYPQFIKEQCQALRGNYEVALYWGDPGAELSKQADLCFGPGINLADMTIWRIR